MISFNKPGVVGKELEYIQEAILSGQISGNGVFSNRCQSLLEQLFDVPKVLLTHSGTAALEMAATLAGIQPGDEVIMPSYTFVTTANAFVVHGAKIVFVDVYPDTLNLNEDLIEAAITPKTKAIVPVHYAGVSCNMDKIMTIAEHHQLTVIEDAAHAVSASYKEKPLGTIGHFGCFSFHETKNLSCGEGGAILINAPDYIRRAEIIWEKGTNRSEFFRGEVDKYSWVDIGSSYQPSELQAAYLYAHLEKAEDIRQDRLACWNNYYEAFKHLDSSKVLLPVIPNDCQHNAHLFHLKTSYHAQQVALIKHLQDHNIQAVFHYVPLHTSEMGQKHGRFTGKDQFTTLASETIVRLPLYYQLEQSAQAQIIQAVLAFYE
ncbi:MAG: dTDP-4-amino-4,6-dideoxygalactose transaminase [Methylococcaceae bacterium]